MVSTTPESENALVDAAWISENVSREDVFVFDCTANIVADANGVERVVAEYENFLKGHIPSAQFINLQAELSDPDSAYNFMLPSASRFEAALRRYGVKRDSTVVVYSTGNIWWATRIWWMFRHFGLDNAWVLNGGFRHWQNQGLPVETGEARPRPASTIAITEELDSAIDGSGLLAKLGDPNLLLVNALSPEKFSGKSPVHGGRPGHIPGSINLPAASLLDPDTGLFLTREEISLALRQKGLLDENKEIVAYCGGGISATLLIFALALAGEDKAKLYDASMSEWGHREDFPIETSIE